MKTEEAPKRQLLSMDNLTGKFGLQLSFDRTAFFRRSRMQFWSLLARVIKPFWSPVMTIGICCNAGKPSGVSDFLKLTIFQLNTLMEEGNQAGDIYVTVRLAFAVCNSTARALIGPTRYHRCDESIKRGLSCGQRVTYPDMKTKPLDGCSFRTKKHSRHHIGVSHCSP